MARLAKVAIVAFTLWSLWYAVARGQAGLLRVFVPIMAVMALFIVWTERRRS